MNLLEQCQKWHENDEFQRIIDALEAIPEAERTPDMVSDLARAYNNIAEPGEKEPLERAVELLLSVREHLEETHNWNYRLGYAYYYLDREPDALPFFQKALEARPGDEDTEEFIRACGKAVTLPRFQLSFGERVAQAWEAFEEIESELRAYIDRRDPEEQEDLVALCDSALRCAFESVSFELGFNGSEYELILTPEGRQSMLFRLAYFAGQAPRSLAAHWNIIVGRQASPGSYELRRSGLQLSAQDVQVHCEIDSSSDQRKVDLTLYSEKLIPVFAETPDTALWMLETLTDHTLGEITAMAVIHSFEASETPLSETTCTLDQLPRRLTDAKIRIPMDAEMLLENSYIAYSLEPPEMDDFIPRMDVFTGSTRLPSLVADYLHGNSTEFDSFYRDGAAAGFLFYPLHPFHENDSYAADILDFRDELERVISDAVGDSVTFLGGATGSQCGYLDFFTWDLRGVLNTAQHFFEQSALPWSAYRSFRRDAGVLYLHDRDDKDSDDEDSDE